MKPVDGDETIDATAQIDRFMDNMAWLPDGKSILVSGSDLTTRAL